MTAPAQATTKICPHCSPPTEKPVSEFAAYTRNKDGLNSYCRACCSAIACAWSARNRERVNAQRQARRKAGRYEAHEKAYRKQYYAQNKEAILRKHKEWLDRHREHYRAYCRKRYARRREHIRTLALVRYHANIDYFRAYDRTRRRSQGKKAKLLARTCPQCRQSLQKREGETWKVFALRTLCGKPACLKRQIDQARWAQEKAVLRNAQEAYSQAQEAARQARIRQARAWSDADAREQAEYEIRRRGFSMQQTEAL